MQVLRGKRRRMFTENRHISKNLPNIGALQNTDSKHMHLFLPMNPNTPTLLIILTVKQAAYARKNNH